MLCKISKMCRSHIVVEVGNLVMSLLMLPLFLIEKFIILKCVIPVVSL